MDQFFDSHHSDLFLELFLIGNGEKTAWDLLCRFLIPVFCKKASFGSNNLTVILRFNFESRIFVGSFLVVSKIYVLSRLFQTF